MGLDHGGRRGTQSKSPLSRRSFLGVSAGLAGAVLSRDVTPVGADQPPRPTCGAGPKPIPGGFSLTPGGEVFHAFGFAFGMEPSTITDFNGFVGSCRLRGTGHGTPESGTPLVFQADTRFMKGQYIGIDGQRHHGTFGFV